MPGATLPRVGSTAASRPALAGGPFLLSATVPAERVPRVDEGADSPHLYPYSIPAVRALVAPGELAFHPRVTFLVGENGSGKSTVVEAIAVAAGFNAEGGSKHFAFATRRTESPLHEAFRLARGPQPAVRESAHLGQLRPREQALMAGGRQTARLAAGVGEAVAVPERTVLVLEDDDSVILQTRRDPTCQCPYATVEVPTGLSEPFLARSSRDPREILARATWERRRPRAGPRASGSSG